MLKHISLFVCLSAFAISPAFAAPAAQAEIAPGIDIGQAINSASVVVLAAIVAWVVWNRYVALTDRYVRHLEEENAAFRQSFLSQPRELSEAGFVDTRHVQVYPLPGEVGQGCDGG